MARRSKSKDKETNKSLNSNRNSQTKAMIEYKINMTSHHPRTQNPNKDDQSIGIVTVAVKIISVSEIIL